MVRPYARDLAPLDCHWYAATPPKGLPLFFVIIVDTWGLNARVVCYQSRVAVVGS